MRGPEEQSIDRKIGAPFLLQKGAGTVAAPLKEKRHECGSERIKEENKKAQKMRRTASRRIYQGQP